MTLTFLSCEDKPAQRAYPRIRTLEVTNISENGATFVAEVYDEGDVEITEHGFTWSQSLPDVLTSERILMGGLIGMGRFEAEISTALGEGITYEVCAFVKAGDYTVYGDIVQFMSLGSGAPEVTDFMPKSAGWGDTIIITGRKFSHLNYTNKIYIDECMCVPFYASDTLLKFVLPMEVVNPQNTLSVSILGNVTVAAEKLVFTSPEIYGFSPIEGHWGDTITFTGKYLRFFGQLPSDGMVLNENLLCKVVKWDNNSLSFIIPGQLNTVSSPVSLSYKTFNFSFPQILTLLPSAADSISPAEGTWGTLVTLYGKFNLIPGLNRVQFGDKQATIFSSSRDSLVVRVPYTLSEYVSLIRYSSEPFTNDFNESFKLKEPEITDFEPKQGYVGNTIKIRGKNFKKNDTSVAFGTSPAIVMSANDTLITCYVPGDIYGDCTVSVTLLGHSAVAGELFKSTNHVITGVTPLVASCGDIVTVSGTNFRTGMDIYLSQSSQLPVAIISETETEIKFIVPDWVNYNPWSITATYEEWNSNLYVKSSYTFQDQFQSEDFWITDVTPLTGETGNIITITGTNFCNPVVAFGPVEAEVIEYNSSMITIRVPPLSSGELPVSVTSGGRTHVYPLKYTHSGPWHRHEDLPFLYEYGCGFDFGEEAYVITGGETGTYEKEIYRFNSATSGFTRIPGTFLSTILNPISCTLGRMGYIIGQKSEDFTGIGLEVFNPDSLTLRRLPDYPGTSIVNPCIIADDSVIYAGCGKVALTGYADWYHDFWKYSPATNKWTRLTDCPYDVSFSNMAYLDGRIIALGFMGFSGPRFLLEFDPLTNSWSQTELSEADLGYYLLLDFMKGAKVSVTDDGKWYIGFGDWYQTNQSYGVSNPDINNRFYCFDPSDNSWRTIDKVASPPRTFAFSFSIGGKIFIGGHQIYRLYDFWEYDLQLDQ